MKTKNLPSVRAAIERYEKFYKEGTPMEILIRWNEDHTQARIVDVLPLNETKGGEL